MQVSGGRGALTGWLLNRPALQFDSVLANRLQTACARRATTMFVLLAAVPVGAFVAWSVWTIIAPPGSSDYWFIFSPDPGVLWTALLMLLLLGWPVVQRLLFLAVRSALPLPGVPFDERQRLVAMRAEVVARRLTLLAMGGAGVAGMAMILIGAAGSSVNLAPLFAWVFSTLFVCAANAHFLVLGWTLSGDDDAEAEDRE